MTFTTEVNNKDFEQYLCELTDNNQLQYSRIKENGATLHLYYNDWGHIGTWQAPGHGVIFEKIIFATSEDDFQLQGSRVVNKNGQLYFKEGVNI